MNRKIELLSPAGDLEKLKTAIEYGADAVYMGGELFSLRAGADNFSVDELKEGVAYAHRKGRKCHLAVNIFAHNEDIPKLDKYIDTVKMIGFDAFIVSDPAIIEMIKDKIPDAEIHLSTQANMTNRMTANFWYNQGVKRIVLGKKITKKARIEATVLNSLTPISKAEICEILPDVSPTTVEAEEMEKLKLPKPIICNVLHNKIIIQSEIDTIIQFIDIIKN